MIFYVNDSGSGKGGEFRTLPDTIRCLEDICLHRFKKDRKTFMEHMASIGHGYDDPEGHTFTSLLGEYGIESGVIRSDGRFVKTNIHEFLRNNKHRNEMGD